MIIFRRNGTMSKADGLLKSIRSLSESKENNGFHLGKFKPEDDEFAKVAGTLSSFSPDEFQYFEESLLRFVILEWEDVTNCCFITLELIADIFIFISIISEKITARRYMHFFSQPEMPPQVLLVLYPAVAGVLDRLNTNDREQDDIPSLRYLRRKLEEHINDGNDPSAGNWVLIGEFLRCYDSLVTHWKTDSSSLSEWLKLLLEGLKLRKNEQTAVLCGLILISMSTLHVSKNLLSEVTHFLNCLSKVVAHLHHLRLKDFLTSCMSTFLTTVSLEDETCLNLIENVKITSVPSSVRKDALKQLSETTSDPPSLRKPGEISTESAGVRFDKPSTSQSATASGSPESSKTGSSSKMCEKYLDLLEKLVGKMKTSKVEFTMAADKTRLKGLLEDLNEFL